MKNPLIPVDKSKKVRVIIDTDAACEADDQYAIAHALMSDKVDVVGIIAEHFGELNNIDTMEESYKEIQKILNLMDIKHIPVYKGARKPLVSQNSTVPNSDGTQLIINECLKADNRPLFIISQGALTTIASAILMHPKALNKAVCISIGGCHYPKGGFEFNYHNDIAAVNVVMASDMSVWQVPEEVYSQMQAGIYELYQKVHPCGRLGMYLYEHLIETAQRMTHFVPPAPGLSTHEQSLSFPNGESWSFGDSCGIGIILCSNAGTYKTVPAPRILTDGTYQITTHTADTCQNDNLKNMILKESEDVPQKMIRIYSSINSRVILEDFYAKLAYHFS